MVEMELERRLFERGYLQVLRPCRLDHAVDYCVWTSKGWLGIQVKTVQRVKRGPEHVRRRERLDMAWAGRGKSYYAVNGVQIFAVWSGRGFYLIPIGEIAREQRIGLKQMAAFWEAWDRVLGEPASVIHARPAKADQGELFSA